MVTGRMLSGGIVVYCRRGLGHSSLLHDFGSALGWLLLLFVITLLALINVGWLITGGGKCPVLSTHRMGLVKRDFVGLDRVSWWWWEGK
jgi:amino acid transporter